MFVYNKESEITKCEPGVTRKVLTYSNELMMCEVTFETGARGMEHSHSHLQITYISEGSFEFTVGDETKRVSKGDSVYIPSDTIHGVLCLEAGVLVDVFNPMREDFI